MNINKAVKVLLALRRMGRLLGRGEVFTLGDVVKASKMARSTVYRYLEMLIVLGHVSKVSKVYRSKPAAHYVISAAGLEFLRSEGV